MYQSSSLLLNINSSNLKGFKISIILGIELLNLNVLVSNIQQGLYSIVLRRGGEESIKLNTKRG